MNAKTKSSKIIKHTINYVYFAIAASSGGSAALRISRGPSCPSFKRTLPWGASAYAHGGAVPATSRDDSNPMCCNVAVVISAQCIESRSPASAVNSACRGASASNSVPRIFAIHSSSRVAFSGEPLDTPVSALTATVAYSSYACEERSRSWMFG